MANTNWKIKSQHKGSAAPMSDYIWGRGYHHDRQDVVATGCGNLPDWCEGDPVVFFRASDQFERRGGRAARQLVISLPRELVLADWINLVENLIAVDIGPKPYQYAIHLSHGIDHEDCRSVPTGGSNGLRLPPPAAGKNDYDCFAAIGVGRRQKPSFRSLRQCGH